MMGSHQVMVLVLDGALPLDVGIPTQVFHARDGLPYELTVCGFAAGAVPSSGGFGYTVPRGLDALAEADTIIVPGYAPVGRPIPVGSARSAPEGAFKRSPHRIDLLRRVRPGRRGSAGRAARDNALGRGGDAGAAPSGHRGGAQCSVRR